jgi:hypothetical protein
MVPAPMIAIARSCSIDRVVTAEPYASGRHCTSHRLRLARGGRTVRAMHAAVDPDRLQRDLEAIVGPRRVSIRAVDLDTYARDMWPRLLLAHREGSRPAHRPHAVVWPEHVREIVAIVKLARELALPIVPYGGGSACAAARCRSTAASRSTPSACSRCARCATPS